MYTHKLTVVENALKKPLQRLKNGNDTVVHAHLFRFEADPPTTTMQRIKALTTGTLPTFIDVKDNFASSEITEDNIIAQIIAANRTAVFVGDDTWMSLFPGKFTESYPFPSFDVKDLHTVDNGVRSKIFDFVWSDHDLVVAHLLGVDHVGHRYAPSHPEMALKLKQMNDLIERLLTVVDERPGTILFVMGDHGMTSDGNHGGASIDETIAGLFVYAHTEWLPSEHPINGMGQAVLQIDLIPTISALFGIPIPFCSLGKLITSLLPSSALNTLIRNNIHQVRNFLDAYEYETENFGKELQEIKDRFSTVLTSHLNSVLSANCNDEHHPKCLQFIDAAVAMCRSRWTIFRTTFILAGLMTVFIAFALCFDVHDFIKMQRVCSFMKIKRSKSSIRQLLHLFPTFIHFQGLFSNSYILHESRVVRVCFCLISLVNATDCSLRLHSLKPFVTACLELTTVWALVSIKSLYGSSLTMFTFDGITVPAQVMTMASLLFLLFFAHYATGEARLNFMERICILSPSIYWLQPLFRTDSSENLNIIVHIWLPRMLYMTSAIQLVLARKLRLVPLLPVLLLLCGPSSAPVFLFTLIIIASWRHSRCHEASFDVVQRVFMLSILIFYATNHRPEISALQIGSAFIGFSTFHFGIAGAMLLLNTFVGTLITIVTISDDLSPVERRRISALFIARALCTMLNAYVQRRHLMVWAIFAPKLLFDVIDGMAAQVFMIISPGRICHQSTTKAV